MLLRSRAIWSDPSTEVIDVLRFKDGRIYQRYTAPHRVNSTIVGRFASFRDIGESVRAAEAIEQHRAFLEKAQEVAHIGSWVAELDSTNALGWSAETHRIFGVPLGQFVGTSEAFFGFVHEEDRDGVRRASEAATENNVPYEVEHRIVRADGTIRWVQEKADVLRDASGRATRMVGTVQDITDRRQLEDQLRQSQKMEAIGRLAGGIAHDLNNALTAIAGYAELALGEVPPGHAARPDVEEIRKAAERAGSVTRQLLAFSRKQLLEPRLFNINDTVVNIARLLTRLLGARCARRDEAGRVTPRSARRSRTGRAGDHQPRGQRARRDAVGRPADAHHLGRRGRRGVRAQTYADGSREVRRAPRADTGHGMTRETQARVFEPFFTTKEIGKGTGLGLSMVYGTLKQIGGFIFVDSEVGRGTTFRLYFPPAAVRVAATPPDAAPAPTAVAARKGHETLLIVEDEDSVRNLVASALRHDGYELLLATSAEEALRLDEQHTGPIDLLLTDAIMPGKSGIELATAMAARRPGLPVIIMSGYTEEMLTGTALDKPISLLQKPFTPRELRRRIRDVLDR